MKVGQPHKTQRERIGEKERTPFLLCVLLYYTIIVGVGAPLLLSKRSDSSMNASRSDLAMSEIQAIATV
jgi:hypothetical protein